jgi:hypothetical protein
MHKTIWCCLAVIATVYPALTQQTNSTSDIRSLAISNTVWINSHAGEAMLLPLRCDSDRSVYVTFYHSTNPAHEPIYKFDDRGEPKAKFSISSDTEFTGRGTGAVEFTLGKDGEVYQLAKGGKTFASYIVAYDKNGSIKSKTKLNPDFSVNRFGVFDSGDFLVTGTPRETDDNVNPHAIFTGIFDSSGKLVKKLVMPEDSDYQKKAERGDSDFFDRDRGGGGNFAVERGTVVRASDGNLYLVRGTIPAKVYAISPGGQVLRTFEVESELPGKTVGTVLENNGILAFQFVGNSDDTRSIIELVTLTGEKSATYDSSKLGIAFACYAQPATFTFLSVKDGNLQLITAEPR